MSSTNLMRISLLFLLTVSFGTIMLIPTHWDFAQAQSRRESSIDVRSSAANNYGFSEATPHGEWIVRADFDLLQASDPTVPVVLAGIRTYTGKGAWQKQLMIENVTLNNRTKKAVQQVKLGWIILSEQDRNAGKNREAALVEGYTNPFKLESSSERMRKLKSVLIDSIKQLKPLLRDGRLNGSFYIRVRVSEVYFSDGSSWKEDKLVAGRKLLYAHARPSLAQVNCTNERCGPLDEDLQRWCEPDPFPGFICRRENCNPNELQACFCNLYSCAQCKDLDGDGWFDCEGDCWDEANNVDAFNTHPGADEICNDGVDNDCDPSTPDGAGCIPPTPTPSPTPTPMPTGCGASPDFFGNCPSGFSNNGCSQCCSNAERDACTASGGYYYLRAGTCQSSVCWEQQYECMGWNESWNMYLCQCTGPCPGTPVLVDVAGNGFNLTNKANGVFFDLNGDGKPERLSWTAAGSDDAWLVFDRDGDGLISQGAELFGNFTYQPNTALSAERHGFLALSGFDQAASSANGGYGGNGDGKITASDGIFSSLRLWRDVNHNGISEPGELRTLQSAGLATIELDHRESRRRDEHGNVFRYRAKVKGANGEQLGRWAWDVFLINSP